MNRKSSIWFVEPFKKADNLLVLVTLFPGKQFKSGVSFAIISQKQSCLIYGHEACP